MVSISDVVMVCQEAISGVMIAPYDRRVVFGVLFGMSESGIITEAQEEYFRNHLYNYTDINEALSQMVVLDMEWGD